MKKLLFSAYSLSIGGIETALITLLKNIQNDYDITLALEKKEGIFLEDLPKSIKIITYKTCDIKNIILRKSINFFKQQIFKIKYKNKFDFSACFATYSYPASFIARISSKNRAIWVHNDFMNFYNNNEKKYKDFFNKLRINKYQKIVFVSKNDENVFLTQFPKYKDKCICCNNLIDYTRIIDLSKEKIKDFEKEEIPTFINIGRHDEKQKRLSRIIESAKKLNKEGYKFRVLFIGDGIDTTKYKSISKDIPNLIFLGPKKNPYPYLKQSDCLLLSSDYEGYPVVFIESLVLNKPIVTTDVSDSKEEIDKKYGIVVDKSTDGIYNGMKKFLNEGLKTKKFDPEKYNTEILEKIKNIIE